MKPACILPVLLLSLSSAIIIQFLRLSIPSLSEWFSGKAQLVSFVVEEDQFFTIYHMAFAPISFKDNQSGYSFAFTSHCSANNLHYIPGMIARYSGPLSLAIICSQDDRSDVLNSVMAIATCFPAVQKYVQFHIVFKPFGFDNAPEIEPVGITCDKLEEYLKNRFYAQNYVLDEIVYPINYMKNVGRLGLQSDFVITVDIDMLPSADLHQQIVDLLNSWKDKEDLRKVALVLPVFEAMENSPIPINKQELITAFRKEYVREFYVEICEHCQHATDVQRWFGLKIDNSSLQVAYFVDYVALWEPFVITSSRAPLHDRNFVQYGYDRTAHICELHVAGYKFAVLDNGFLVHQGFKRHKGLHANRWKENSINSQLYIKFQDSLKVKYPNSTRNCNSAG